MNNYAVFKVCNLLVDFLFVFVLNSNTVFELHEDVRKLHAACGMFHCLGQPQIVQVTP